MQNTAATVSLAFTIGTYLVYAYYYYVDAQKPQKEQKFPPAKVTWFIWASVDAVIASAMLGGGYFAPQMWVYVAGSGAIAIYDFYRDPHHFALSKIDKYVLGFAGLAMILWYLTSGVAAIAISLVAVIVGSFPLWRATWKNPRTIPWIPWAVFLAGGIAGAISSVQLHGWTWIDDLGPCAFLVAQVFTLAIALPIRQPRTTT